MVYIGIVSPEWCSKEKFSSRIFPKAPRFMARKDMLADDPWTRRRCGALVILGMPVEYMHSHLQEERGRVQRDGAGWGEGSRGY